METQYLFTGLSELYTKYRPAYPEALFSFLSKEAGLSPDSLVADIGAGTGILTKQLLGKGASVTAVEPNVDMRAQAERALASHPKFRLLSSSAEQTGIEENSIDLITAAQAFHWFDKDGFRIECKRILKPGKKVALIWNSRNKEITSTQKAAEICQRFCLNFNGFSGGMESSPEDYEKFFLNGSYQIEVFENPVYCDLEGYIGRNLSSSYAPRKGEANYIPFVEELTNLFHQYSQDGKLIEPYLTRCYLGRV